jgi:hypothetical protein
MTIAERTPTRLNISTKVGSAPSISANAAFPGSRWAIVPRRTSPSSLEAPLGLLAGMDVAARSRDRLDLAVASMDRQHVVLLPQAARRVGKDELFGDALAGEDALDVFVDHSAERLVMDEVDHPAAQDLLGGQTGSPPRNLTGGPIHPDQEALGVVEHQVIRNRVEHVGEATVLRRESRFGHRGEPVADDAHVARRNRHLPLVHERVDRPLEQTERRHQRCDVELDREAGLLFRFVEYAGTESLDEIAHQRGKTLDRAAQGQGQRGR